MAAGVGFDFSDRYDLGELIARDGDHSIFAASERSLKAGCIFHRLNLGHEISPTERQGAIAVIKRYASISGAHFPRLAEGWVTDDHICFVEYGPRLQPLSATENNPFGYTRGFRRFEIIDSMLALLTVLHRVGVVHGAVTPETFALAPRNRVHLIETGVVRALRKAVQEREDISYFSLSDNLSAKDLAQLTFAVATMINGKPLLSNPPDEAWDAVDFREARGGLESAFVKPELVDFFDKCLQGYGSGTPHFGSAVEAWKFWQANHIGRFFL